MDASQVQAAADRLSAKLDALDLEADERAVLEAVLTAGAQSVESADGEVEGFAFEGQSPPGTPPGQPGQHVDVTLGLRKSGGSHTTSGQVFLRFSFKL